MPRRRRRGTKPQTPRQRSLEPESFGTHIDENCYVCGRRIAAEAKVRLLHETMVHEACYLRHLQP
jgi:hypothetical protein